MCSLSLSHTDTVTKESHFVSLVPVLRSLLWPWHLRCGSHVLVRIDGPIFMGVRGQTKHVSMTPLCFSGVNYIHCSLYIWKVLCQRTMTLRKFETVKVKVANYDFVGKKEEVFPVARQLPESHPDFLLVVVQTEKHPFFLVDKVRPKVFLCRPQISHPRLTVRYCCVGHN